jgi:hypothetical protein
MREKRACYAESRAYAVHLPRATLSKQPFPKLKHLSHELSNDSGTQLRETEQKWCFCQNEMFRSFKILQVVNIRIRTQKMWTSASRWYRSAGRHGTFYCHDDRWIAFLTKTISSSTCVLYSNIKTVRNDVCCYLTTAFLHGWRDLGCDGSCYLTTAFPHGCRHLFAMVSLVKRKGHNLIRKKKVFAFPLS